MFANLNLEFTIILFTFAHSKFAISTACKFLKMDIATRLKQFMAAKNIASSQFADSADIPRPTLSQLLNGRNKKISNELIGKIHDAFPTLNVLWLMFGEGEMEGCTDMQISEPQKAAAQPASEVQEPRYEAVWVAQAPDYDNRAPKPNRTQDMYQQQNPPRQSNERPISAEAMQALSNVGVRMGDTARVQQIMVLYTDGRFETFKPAEQ